MWWVILICFFVLVVIYFTFETFDKRLKMLEEDRGTHPTNTFTVNAFYAVSKNKWLGKVLKIKSKEGKIWSGRLYKEIEQKTFVRLTYLQSDDIYFIQDNNNSYFDLPNTVGRNRNLYTASFAKGDDLFMDDLLFKIDERTIKSEKGKDILVITGYLVEKFKDEKKKWITHVLFDLPFDWRGLDEKMFGFEKEGSDIPDTNTNDFGELEVSHNFITLKKNDVEINFI